MNASGPAAKPPPPTTTQHPITSLTSSHNNNATTSGTTTSIAEALATTVADYVCDAIQKNNHGTSTTTTTPQSTPAKKANGSTTTPQRQPRIVSLEHSNNKASPPPRAVAPRTVSTSSNNNNNCSSMSSAVADLASGMSIFQPSSNSNSKPKKVADGNTTVGGSHTSSAPIISGTAAAVLALQSTFYDTSEAAIVSNSGSVDNTPNNNHHHHISLGGGKGGGGMGVIGADATTTTSTSTTSVPDPFKSQPLVELSGAASSPQHSPTSPDNHSMGMPSYSSSKAIKKFPTRYSDGAPIIAGTAAAQMEAIATATAARITSITNDDGGSGGMSDGIFDAVASLGAGAADMMMMSQFGTGGETRSHGFTGWSNGSSKSLTSTGATVTKRGSKALTWVDHRKVNHRAPSQDAVNTSHGAYQVSSSAQQQNMTAESSTARAGGGMDILAEITSHAPPMATPSRISQATAASTTNNMTTSSYQQQHHAGTASIPSYQEIYASQQHQQPQHHQVHQQPPQAQQQTSLLMSPTTQKRVSAIPSYQEIYREMGLSPQQHQPHQQLHNEERTHSHHYSATSYSVEEVQVEHTSSNDHHSQHSKSNNNNAASSSATSRAMSHHYNSRAPSYHFGHVHGTKPRHYDNYDGLEEGKELYTRKDLMVLGGHLHELKEVHGNMREGCDSLIVGCLDKDIREVDGLLWFLYSTDRPNGGGALCQSYHKKRPIRIFRSSLLGGKYAPPFLDVEDDVEEDSDVAFRYDGLYMVRAVWDTHGHETESFPVSGADGWQTYFFTRVPKKPLEKEKIEEGMEYNLMGCQELWGSIQKMKGVRRPKKFEIPPPPVKLGPMKKAAISGVYKDRKCVGYERPEPVVPAVAPPPKPPPQAPRSKSPRTVSNEKQQKREPQGEDEDSHSSSEEPTHSRKPQHKQDEESDSESDSESLRQPKKQSAVPASPLSAVRSPSKVIMPRPRLNSISHSPKKNPPPVAHDDSSDSETSTSASLVVQRKRRKHTPSPKMKLLNRTFDHSAFFPKRASAARAEAANRDMFKRKSSETTSSSTTANAAAQKASKPAPPPRPKSTRKRAKIVPAKNYDSSSSSSSEEPPPDVVDQSVLTVGSRVLVVYKGSLFKATIRKRREKNGKHDFLIHYDGNKRTNVHWVPIDRISEILEINVDTPPKQKAPPVVKNEKKGGRNNGKRKAPSAKQESIESQHSAEMDVDDSDEPSRKKTAANRQDSIDSEPDMEESAMSRQVSLQQSHYDEHLEEAGSKSPAKAEDPLASPVKESSQINEVAAAKANGASQSNESGPLQSDGTAADEKDTNPSTTVNKDEHGDVAPSHKRGASEAAETVELKKSESKVEESTHEPKSDGAAALGLKQNAVAEEKSSTESEQEPSGIPPKQFSSNIKTTTAAGATARKPRKTVVSDVCHAQDWKSSDDSGPTDLKDPLLALAMEAEADLSDEGDIGSVAKESDENNSTGSIDNNVKLEQTTSEPTSEFKYPIGGHVYVEYRQVYYSSTILKARRKRSVSEYLVHYEGYKRSSNRWVKENALHEVNAVTTQRFEEQRFIPAEILYESEQSSDFNMVTRRKKATKTSEPPSSSDISDHPAAQKPPAQKKAPPRRLRSDASDAALETLEAGVDFLPGSMVFVEWSGALYLAKMVKKRYSGERMEYLISYDGYKSSHDAWVSIHKIYEVNPKTKRVFKQIMSDQTASDGKKQRRAPPGQRRETRKKTQDDEAAAIAAVASVTSVPMSRTRNSSESNNQSHQPSRGSSRSQSLPAGTTIMSDVMQGIEPGVEFLPGSTLFAEYKGGLCLAKMLKKRGKGSYMEYYIQYNGLKKAEEAWVSTSLVYEINPQTKRMFRQLSKN